MIDGAVDIHIKDTEYPNLEAAIYLLGGSHDMSVKPISQWPDFINYEFLEESVSLMNEGEVRLFVAGETSEQQLITKKHKIHQLSMFFSMIFDGPLNNFFIVSRFFGV